MSESIHATTCRDVRTAQTLELHAFPDEQRVELFADAAPLTTAHRALRISWRGGLPYAVTLDTRRRGSRLDPRQATSAVLTAPIFSKLRRLTIRCKSNEVPWIGDAILNVNRAADFEELIIGERPYPTTIGLRSRGAANAREQALETLYPRLWLLAFDNRVTPLFDNDAAAKPMIETKHGEFSAPAQLVGMSKQLRVSDYTQMGRCLWSPELRLRVSALRVIARRGVSGRFASSIKAILRPNVCRDQDEMIRALGEAGGQRLSPTVIAALARISGSSKRYDVMARAIAGTVLALDRKKMNP